MTEQELQNMRDAEESWRSIGLRRKQDIDGALPSWSQVETACDNISSLAEAKAFLRKLSRVVYWVAKGRQD